MCTVPLGCFRFYRGHLETEKEKEIERRREGDNHGKIERVCILGVITFNPWAYHSALPGRRDTETRVPYKIIVLRHVSLCS